MSLGPTQIASLSGFPGQAPAGTARPAGADDPSFEVMLLDLVMREMQRTVPKGPLSSGAADLFMGQFHQHLADLAAGTLGGTIDQVHVQPAGGCPGTMPCHGSITSTFGNHTDPFTGLARMHQGLDLAAPAGTPVRPIAAGQVIQVEDHPTYGKLVRLDHGRGFTSLYAHCDSIQVSPGDNVHRSQVLGTVGSTGRSTGPHLHLEVHRDGEPVDPLPYLRLRAPG